MPKIEDLVKIKFKKSNYRPWNFLDELEKEESISISLDNKKKSEIYRDELQPSFTQSEDKLETTAASSKSSPQVKDQDINNIAPPPKEITVSNALAMREQSVSKALAQPLAMREQSVSNKNESVSKALAEALAQPLAMREQSVSKALANCSIESLVGNEKKLLSLLFNKCTTSGSLETPIVTSEELKEHIKTSTNHVRNIIFRLIKKGFLQTKEIKNGRAGWRKFVFPKEVYQHLILEHSVSNALANRKQSVSKVLAEALAEPLANVSSSSSVNNINTTTTALPENWTNLDLSEGKCFGFTNNHLIQFYKHGGLDPKLIQESVRHFAFDLEKNNKAKEIKTNPLSYFMGILRRAGVYAAPDNYESLQDQAMRIYVEKKKLLASKREAMERELLDLSFQDWVKTLSEAEIEQLIPQDVKKLKLEAPKKAALRTHFEKTVWVAKKVEIMKEVNNG